jgi:hypothetical protein
MNIWQPKNQSMHQRQQTDNFFADLGEIKSSFSSVPTIDKESIHPINVTKVLLQIIKNYPEQNEKVGERLMEKFDFNKLVFARPRFQYPIFLYYSIFRVLHPLRLDTSIFSDKLFNQMMDAEYDWNTEINRKTLIDSFEKLGFAHAFFQALSPRHRSMFNFLSK